MNRNQRAKVAQETLSIIESGSYINKNSEFVDIKEEISRAISSSMHYDEQSLATLLEEAMLKIKERGEQGGFNYFVENCTTFSGVRKLLEVSDKVVCLNFASAKNPGGGFLGGSQAQEEALARASALYPCLTKHMDMYLNNRQQSRLLYSHDMIYSKGIPVFRDDRDELLDDFFSASIITSAAVNAGSVLRKQPESGELIEKEMLSRARYVLSIAVANDYRNIVLGAWGCGVFRNKPPVIAEVFFQLLESESFKYCFDNVFFAVLDSTKDKKIFHAFHSRFM